MSPELRFKHGSGTIAEQEFVPHLLHDFQLMCGGMDGAAGDVIAEVLTEYVTTIELPAHFIGQRRGFTINGSDRPESIHFVVAIFEIVEMLTSLSSETHLVFNSYGDLFHCL